jgi:hypothetical protein
MSEVLRGAPQGLGDDHSHPDRPPQAGSRKRLLTGELTKYNLRIPSNFTSDALLSNPESSSPRKKPRYSKRQVGGGREHLPAPESAPEQPSSPTLTSTPTPQNTRPDMPQGTTSIGDILRSFLTRQPYANLYLKIRQTMNLFAEANVEEEMDIDSNHAGEEQTMDADADSLHNGEPAESPDSHHTSMAHSEGDSESGPDDMSQGCPIFEPTITQEQETPMSSYGSVLEPDQLCLKVAEQGKRSARMVTPHLPVQVLLDPVSSDEAHKQQQGQEESGQAVDADTGSDDDIIEILEMISSPGHVTKGPRSTPNLATPLLRPPASEGLSPTLDIEHNGFSWRSGSLDPGSPPTSEPGPISSGFERDHSFEVIVFPGGLQPEFERDRDPASILLDTASVTDFVAREYVDKLNMTVRRLAEVQTVVGIGGEIVEIKEWVCVGLEWHRGQFRKYYKFYILEGGHKFQLLWGSKTIAKQHILIKPELGKVYVSTKPSKKKISPGMESTTKLTYHNRC